MYILVIKQLAVMALIVLSGFIFATIFKVQENEQKFISKMLLYFINPFLVFSSFNMEFNPEKLKYLLFTIIVSFIIHFLVIFISIVLIRLKNQDEHDYKIIDRLAVTFTNCGFVGIPLIRGVFGNEGVFYLMGYLIVFNVLLWTYGYYQMCGKTNIKKILTNPNIIAVALGLIVYVCPFTLPELISRPVDYIGDMNTPLAMILVGILFADFRLSKKYIIRLLRVCSIRLILVSVINLLLIMFVYYISARFNIINDLQILKLMLFVVYICSMCPCATSIPSLSCIFNKDAQYASLIVCLTSLLCIVSIPLFVALAEKIIDLISVVF
ncbi:MAG: AEC family transporter [Treponema sp.]|nr:AEC family transporter [Treponema sp.]